MIITAVWFKPELECHNFGFVLIFGSNDNSNLINWLMSLLQRFRFFAHLVASEFGVIFNVIEKLLHNTDFDVYFVILNQVSW